MDCFYYPLQGYALDVPAYLLFSSRSILNRQSSLLQWPLCLPPPSWKAQLVLEAVANILWHTFPFHYPDFLTLLLRVHFLDVLWRL